MTALSAPDLSRSSTICDRSLVLISLILVRNLVTVFLRSIWHISKLMRAMAQKEPTAQLAADGTDRLARNLIAPNPAPPPNVTEKIRLDS